MLLQLFRCGESRTAFFTVGDMCYDYGIESYKVLNA